MRLEVSGSLGWALPAALLLGYFLFLGFVAMMALILLHGRQQWRRGLIPRDPLRWTIAGTLLLLIIATITTRLLANDVRFYLVGSKDIAE